MKAIKMAKNIMLLSLIMMSLGVRADKTTESEADQVDQSDQIRIPLEAEIQRYMLATKSFLDKENYGLALEYLKRAAALKSELPAEYYYYKGKLHTHEGQLKQARSSFEEYILRSDASSEYYTQSLEMITSIETQTPSFSQVQDAKQEITWENDNTQTIHSEYLEEMKSLYLTDSPQKALVTHINTLLESVPFVDTASQLNESPAMTKTSISVSDDGKINVQKNITNAGDTQIMSFSTSVFGLSRDFIVKCEPLDSRCSIQHKDSLNTWFKIQNDQAVARDLTQAIEALVILLQSNGK